MDEKVPSSDPKLRININYIILALILIGIIALLGTGSYYLFSKKKTTTSITKNLTPTPAAKPGDPNTYALPLPFTHPNVANGKFYYTVGGDVRTISSNRITLISKDDKNDLPPFPLTEQTVFAFGDKSPATLSDVEVGKFVYISANYDLSTRSWTVTNITVYK